MTIVTTQSNMSIDITMMNIISMNMGRTRHLANRIHIGTGTRPYCIGTRTIPTCITVTVTRIETNGC
jgi:hypothetical protein